MGINPDAPSKISRPFYANPPKKHKTKVALNGKWLANVDKTYYIVSAKAFTAISARQVTPACYLWGRKKEKTPTNSRTKTECQTIFWVPNGKVDSSFLTKIQSKNTAKFYCQFWNGICINLNFKIFRKFFEIILNLFLKVLAIFLSKFFVNHLQCSGKLKVCSQIFESTNFSTDYYCSLNDNSKKNSEKALECGIVGRPRRFPMVLCTAGKNKD